MKNSMTPSGIEPATFWFVAQYVNHRSTAVSLLVALYSLLYNLISNFCEDPQYLRFVIYRNNNLKERHSFVEAVVSQVIKK
jgi:hypothetical protein